MSEMAQKPTRWGRLLLLGGILLGGAFLVRSFGLQEVLNLHNIVHLKAWIEGFGALAPLVFMTGYILAVIFFAPGLPITVLGGVAFGPLWGTVYVSIASTIGVALAFLIARYGARRVVERWLEQSPRLAKIDQAVARHGWR
ncbi:MAG: TVP38/TMEM64 family protein, partial [candidate division NC10 bacterium]|nr:TVP38/TMEM64 family protein [candidate division NC10 bacterium]